MKIKPNKARTTAKYIRNLVNVEQLTQAAGYAMTAYIRTQSLEHHMDWDRMSNIAKHAYAKQVMSYLQGLEPKNAEDIVQGFHGMPMEEQQALAIFWACINGYAKQWDAGAVGPHVN